MALKAAPSPRAMKESSDGARGPQVSFRRASNHSATAVEATRGAPGQSRSAFDFDFSQTRVHARANADSSAPMDRAPSADELAGDSNGGGAAPTTTASPSGSATPTAPVCTQPVNFRLGTAVDTGPDAIVIPIGWGSSTGNLADLGNCTIREVVNYGPIPDPPFAWRPPNPTILPVAGTAGTAGAAGDTHS